MSVLLLSLSGIAVPVGLSVVLLVSSFRPCFRAELSMPRCELRFGRESGTARRVLHLTFFLQFSRVSAQVLALCRREHVLAGELLRQLRVRFDLRGRTHVSNSFLLPVFCSCSFWLPSRKDVDRINLIVRPSRNVELANC